MIINSANLRSLTTGYRTTFLAGLAAATTMWTRFATEVPSTTAEELYPWLNQIPGMRKWIGERQIKNVSTGAYRLINEDWEDTISVNRNAIEDDRFGVYSPLMSMLGEAAARQPDELMFGTIGKGFNTNSSRGEVARRTTAAPTATALRGNREFFLAIRGALDEGRLVPLVGDGVFGSGPLSAFRLVSALIETAGLEAGMRLDEKRPVLRLAGFYK